MLAHYHGQTWNAAEPGAVISESPSRPYGGTSISFSGVFMIRQLLPWHANLKKRQVKAPKVYLRDTGLLHHLLGIRSEKELLMHPKSGASWEGYVIEETLHQLRPDEAYYWATHNGAEIDLVMIKDGRMLGVECKRLDAPKLTPSMKTALQDLHLERLLIIYPGTQRYKIADRIEAVPFEEVAAGGRQITPPQIGSPARGYRGGGSVVMG